MNIFLRELKANRKALLIWSVCMVLLAVSGMAKYSAYTSGSQNSQLFNSMPFTVKALLGFGSFDPTTLIGFYALLFPYTEVTIAIHAVLIGSGIIAKEERDKTTEFLIVKPVSRNVIITSKLLAALVNVIIVNLVTMASMLPMLAAYNKGADISNKVILSGFSMLIVQLIFMSLGAALGAFIRNSKASGSLSAAILLLCYVISKITDLTDKVNFINVFSPFKYFDLKNMLLGSGINIGVLFLSLALAAFFTVLTYVFYRRRDLNV